MSWKTRLPELALAGGLLAGASGGPKIPACNANSAPCCSDPDGGDCAAVHQCAVSPSRACCSTAGYGDYLEVSAACQDAGF